MARQNKATTNKETRTYNIEEIINSAVKTENEKYDRVDFTISPLIKLSHYLFDNGESAIITIDGIWCIKGTVPTAKTGERKGEKFFSYPSYQKKSGQYENTAYCFDKATIDIINKCLNTEV